MRPSSAENPLAALRAEIPAAESRIRPFIRETPLELSTALGRDSGTGVWLKLEGFQLTGSFKVRGALNRILSLDEGARARGVVAASSGNHGAGVAEAARLVGITATVFVPEYATESKVAGIRARGAEVVRIGEDCLETEAAAREDAARRSLAYVSPYNDVLVMAGQATLGVEMARQADPLDAVFVAVGGGGLIGGVGAHLKSVWPDVRIIGTSPRNSCVLHDSLRAGHILASPSLPTLSDATAGGVEPDSVTFPICRDVVDDFVLCEEDEIAAALRLVLDRDHVLLEGAAACAVAAFLGTESRWRGAQVGVVLCGANIGADELRRVL